MQLFSYIFLFFESHAMMKAIKGLSFVPAPLKVSLLRTSFLQHSRATSSHACSRIEELEEQVRKLKSKNKDLEITVSGQDGEIYSLGQRLKKIEVQMKAENKPNSSGCKCYQVSHWE